MPDHPSRLLPRLVFAVLLAGAAWMALRAYASDATRECHALYRDARTAADTTRIDTTVVASGRSQAEPHSCGFMRKSARWR